MGGDLKGDIGLFFKAQDSEPPEEGGCKGRGNGGPTRRRLRGKPSFVRRAAEGGGSPLAAPPEPPPPPPAACFVLVLAPQDLERRMQVKVVGLVHRKTKG